VSHKRLVINADDLGLADSVNRGIIEAIESGVVTSTSLMVNMPAATDAVRRLRELRARGGGASVGLHFNIVAGSPLTDCETLRDPRTGRFLPLLALALKAFTGRLVERDVEAELEAQLDRAESLLAPLGLRVSHIDSHRHAHCFPRIYDTVVRAARSRAIGHVRHAYESRMLLLRPRALAASRLLRAVLARAEPIDDVAFTGIGAMGSRTFDRDIAFLVAALPSGTTELMVHPGYDSPELAAIDPYRAPREREVRALTSPELAHRIRALGVELTRFDAPSAPPVPTDPAASSPKPGAQVGS
jgi:predicted glycoside hydrolase/deacetylase ChbG (UPF0249 family)